MTVRRLTVRRMTVHVRGMSYTARHMTMAARIL